MDRIQTVGRKVSLRTNYLGEYAVGKVVLRCIEKGFPVCRPLIECRYDLVIDDGLKLYRTQVKYGGGSSPKQCQGAISVGLRKWRNNGQSIIPCYTTDEIDAVVVYLRRLDCLLWFGPEVFAGRDRLHIRFEPARNKQMRGCLIAQNYVW